jgi:hypothetical protein
MQKPLKRQQQNSAFIGKAKKERKNIVVLFSGMLVDKKCPGS